MFSLAQAWRWVLSLLLLEEFSRTAVTAVGVVELGNCGEFDKTTRMYHLMDYAAKIALEEGFLTEQVANRSFTINIHTASTMCTSSLASPLVLPLLLGKGTKAGRLYSATENVPPVLAISGCSCSSVSSIVSQLAAPLQVPIISGASTSPSLSNKALHPYFSRTCPPDSKQGAGLAALVKYFGSMAPNGGWTRVVLLHDQESYGEGIADAFVGSELVEALTIYRMPLPFMGLNTVEESTSYDYSSIYSTAEELAAYNPQPRVFIAAVMYLQAISRPFDEAGLWHRLSVVFVGDEGCAVEKLSEVTSNVEAYYAASVEAKSESAVWWEEGAYDWTRTPSVLDGMFCMTPTSQGSRYNSDEFFSFWTNLSRQKFLDAGMPSTFYTDPAWFEDFSMLDQKIWYPLIFDAMTALLSAIGNLLEAGLPIANLTGATLQEAILQVRFEGLSGNVAFDSNGDRLAPYQIRNLVDGAVQDIGLFDSASGNMTFTSSPYFGKNLTSVPADRPDACAAGSEYSGSTCELCSPGYFSPAEDSACVPCPAGTFASGQGSSACTSAPPGSHVPEAGQSEAQLCSPGYASGDIGSESCSACAKGVYSDEEGATECVWCSKGTYADSSAATSCIACPAGETTAHVASTSVSKCICEEGSYRSSANTSCSRCLEGMICPEGSVATFTNTELPYPLVRPGFMSKTNAPLEIYRCLYDGSCPGGDPGQCSSFRDANSVACGVCVEGSYRAGTACRACEGGADVLLIILVAIAAFLALCLGTLLASADAIKTAKSTFTCVAVAGLMLTSLQTLGIFDELSVIWFEPVASILRAMKIFSFDLQVLKIECLAGTDVIFQYAIRQLIVPLSIPIVYIVIRLKKRFRDPKLKAFPEAVNVTGSVLNIFFISVLVSCVAPLVCYPHPGAERSSMRNAPSILCFESFEHTKMVLFGLASFLMVPTPFMTMVIIGVLKYKAMLRGRCSDAYLKGLRFLFIRYQPERHYYIVIALLRSLSICLVPVLLYNAASQIMVLSTTILFFHTVQVKLQPWRGDLPNSVETGCSMALLLLLTAGALLAGLTVQSTTVKVLATVAFVVGWTGVVLILGHLFVRLMRYRGFVYSVFICHHKADAAAQARILKLSIQTVEKGDVFIDSDNLTDLDKLFSIVKTQVRTLVVYLTKHTLTRPWCAGEVTTALLASKAKVVAVRTTSFVPPTESELEDVSKYVDAEGCNLQKYSISFDQVGQAFRKLVSMETNTIAIEGRLLTVAEYDDLARQILARLPQPFSSLRAVSNVSKVSGSTPPLSEAAGQFLICAEPGNDEATAAAGILARKARAYLLHAGDAVEITCLHEHSKEDNAWAEAVEEAVVNSRAVAFLLSSGTMQTKEQLFVIILAMEARSVGDDSLVLIPLLLPGFAFPTATYFHSTLPSLTHDAHRHSEELVRGFFKLIALPFAIDASEHIIDVQVADVAARIPDTIGRLRSGTNLRMGSTLSSLAHPGNASDTMRQSMIMNETVYEI